MINEVDVRENYILKIDRELLSLLLFDHTTRKDMFGAINNHANLSVSSQSIDEIVIENTIGKYNYAVKLNFNKFRFRLLETKLRFLIH